MLTLLACGMAISSPAPPIHREWAAHVLATEDPELTTRDIDGDGVVEQHARWESVGSGGAVYVTCVRHGRTGDVGCRATERSAYSRFTTEAWQFNPHAGNLTAPLLALATCPDDPPGAALTLLRTPTPRWAPGIPTEQPSVCLTDAEAATYGATPADLGLAEHRVWFLAGGPPAGFIDPPLGLHIVANSARFVVYQHGPALAAYEAARDRHAWIVNLAAGNGMFKLDRWLAIDGVRLDGDFLVYGDGVAGWDAERVERRIDLGALARG